MKRIIVATLFALISLSGIGQNTWASLGNNDFVSRLALQNAITLGYFGGKSVSLSTGDFVQKGQATTYCYCNSISGTSTDFAIKSQFVSSFGSNYTIYGGGQYSSGNIYGYTSSSNACSGGASAYSVSMYYTPSLVATSPISIPSPNSAYAYNASGHVGSTHFYWYSGGWIDLYIDPVNGYYINALGSCVTSYVFTFDGYPTTWGTCNAARVSSTGGTAFYASIPNMSTSPTPTITRFFSDAGLTTPYVGAGYGTYISVSIAGHKYGCQVDASGYLLSYSETC
jgi:hypothetical protein